MSVDKFGRRLRGGHEIIQQSIRNTVLNLDGFDERGKKDQLYCFQFNDKKVYVRKEIPFIENRSFNFIFERNKLIAIPAKYEWDIDIQLNNNTYSRANKAISITNSGKIIGTLVSMPPNEEIDDPILLVRNKNQQYCLASRKPKEAHFEFQPENKRSNDILTNPPAGSTIIIEGIIRAQIEEKKEILPGLAISAKMGLSGNYDFKIILAKENDSNYVIKFTTLEIKVRQVSTIALSPVKIHDFYSLCRMRFTTQPVNDYEIKYL